MPADDLERPDHPLAEPRPPLPSPAALPAPNIVQPQVDEPRSDRYREDHAGEPEIAVVRHQPADQRRRLLRDYGAHPERDVRPQPMERGHGLRMPSSRSAETRKWSSPSSRFRGGEGGGKAIQGVIDATAGGSAGRSASSRARNSACRRRAIGPGLPSPTGLPSIRTTGMTSVVVPSRNNSSSR